IYADDTSEIFTFNLSRKLFENEGNVFFSPYSTKIALGMALEGADDTTQVEMLHVLKNVQYPRAELNGAFSSFQSVAIDRSFTPLKSYVDACQKKFKTELMSVDFLTQKENSLKTINGWV